jgi:hypothetical protein
MNENINTMELPTYILDNFENEMGDITEDLNKLLNFSKQSRRGARRALKDKTRKMENSLDPKDQMPELQELEVQKLIKGPFMTKTEFEKKMRSSKVKGAEGSVEKGKKGRSGRKKKRVSFGAKGRRGRRGRSNFAIKRGGRLRSCWGTLRTEELGKE